MPHVPHPPPIPVPSETACREAQRRWDACAKPLGSLALLVVCADNGVPVSVAAAVMRSMAAGRSPVCAMARVAGCEVTGVDAGVLDPPTLPEVLRRRIRNGSGDITRKSALNVAD